MPIASWLLLVGESSAASTRMRNSEYVGDIQSVSAS
jgi:hypothetical protein